MDKSCCSYYFSNIQRQIKVYTFAVVAYLFALFIKLLSVFSNRIKNESHVIIGKICQHLNKLIFGINFEITGLENIIQDSGCVIILNHQAIFDLVALTELWILIDNVNIIAKKQLRYLLPFCSMFGIYFINRENTKEAKHSLNNMSTIINDEKIRLVVFPEGTRNNSAPELKPFKKGAFYLAIAAQCPIQPVVISRYDKFFGDTYIKRGCVTMTILPAISTIGMNKENVNEIVERTYKIMSNCFRDNKD